MHNSVIQKKSQLKHLAIYSAHFALERGTPYFSRVACLELLAALFHFQQTYFCSFRRKKAHDDGGFSCLLWLSLAVIKSSMWQHFPFPVSHDAWCVYVGGGLA